jgi:hypothetical protein
VHARSNKRNVKKLPKKINEGALPVVANRTAKGSVCLISAHFAEIKQVILKQWSSVRLIAGGLHKRRSVLSGKFLVLPLMVEYFDGFREIFLMMIATSSYFIVYTSSTFFSAVVSSDSSRRSIDDVSYSRSILPPRLSIY